MTRQHVASGSPYEGAYGFSRAVRIGDHIHVAGTAPIWPEGVACDPDPAAQMRRCLEIICAALRDAGSSPDDVVRTRIYITDPAIADVVGHVHGEVFQKARPAATMVVVAALLDPAWVVEVEAYAIAA